MPGTRAPHYWLERDGQQISTLDLFDRNFTLLAGPDGAPWCTAHQAPRSQVGLELDVFRLGQGGLQDPAGEFASAYGLEPSGCVLVRPDGFVAWRANNANGASAARLAKVLGAVLSRA